MRKILLATSVALVMSSGCLYASDYQTTYGGNNPYYNSQENDYSNDRGGNDSGYNAYDNSRGEIYGDDNSYRNSNGMIINR